MQKYVTITMNGAKLRASQGSSVLDVAITYGVCIPHLCHVPALTDFGACRLCVVEHVKNGRSKITASCTLEVKDGMVIRTETDRVHHLRKNVAELLVAQAPNSRAIQDIAVRCGVKDSRYPFRNDDCVLCGRCVRLCGELWQAKALGFVGRGKDRRVDFPFGTRPDFCKLCGDCVYHCPMTITPCAGPMKPGEERLCGECASQLTMSADMGDTCVFCDLGKGFQCGRHAC